MCFLIKKKPISLLILIVKDRETAAEVEGNLNEILNKIGHEGKSDCILIYETASSNETTIRNSNCISSIKIYHIKKDDRGLHPVPISELIKKYETKSGKGVSPSQEEANKQLLHQFKNDIITKLNDISQNVVRLSNTVLSLYAMSASNTIFGIQTVLIKKIEEINKNINSLIDHIDNKTNSIKEETNNIKNSITEISNVIVNALATQTVLVALASGNDALFKEICKKLQESNISIEVCRKF